jgi:hypothetical protein
LLLFPLVYISFCFFQKPRDTCFILVSSFMKKLRRMLEDNNTAFTMEWFVSSSS